MSSDWIETEREVAGMGDSDIGIDKSTWAIGGGVMLGIGVGFFFLQTSVFAFVGCILGGIGLGLMITSILSACKRG
jgi:hypothetical protein